MPNLDSYHQLQNAYGEIVENFDPNAVATPETTEQAPAETPAETPVASASDEPSAG